MRVERPHFMRSGGERLTQGVSNTGGRREGREGERGEGMVPQKFEHLQLKFLVAPLIRKIIF